MWIESVAYNLLWPRSLIETSDRVKWDSLIAKGFILEVSSQSLKRREAENVDINDYLFSLTCLVNNVSRLASHICLAGVSYRFFIAAVRS